MKIFLDDDPMRDSWVDDTWTIVRDPKQVLTLLIDNAGQVEILSLDHDLGDDFWSGYDLVYMIEELLGYGVHDKRILPARFEIHSANPVGRKNMQAAIDSIERMRHGNV